MKSANFRDDVLNGILDFSTKVNEGRVDSVFSFWLDSIKSLVQNSSLVFFIIMLFVSRHILTPTIITTTTGTTITVNDQEFNKTTIMTKPIPNQLKLTESF